MKKILQLLSHRVFFVGFAIFLQIIAFVLMMGFFEEYFVYFYSFCILLSIFVVIRILNGNSNPAYKIAWLIPILLLPIFGGMFYLMFGGNRVYSHLRHQMHIIEDEMKKILPHQDQLIGKIASSNAQAAQQSRYIQNYAYSPPFENTQTKYYPTGEAAFEGMLAELKKAQNYIFLEYFIIQEGKMWNTILDVLVEKARQGVDVRVIYDDMGCMFTLPHRYDKTLESMGIQCAVFNRFIPMLSLRFNNRNHRKIMVIDGHVGFTGGINLADEYINAYEKHGHWKDNALLMRGEAVWSLTVMFLSMWEGLRRTKVDFEQFRPPAALTRSVSAPGVVQPFSDNPLDNEPVGETVYLNLINKAERYLYITTPYLIIGNEIMAALQAASKGGVDIRIITPHVPDKWYVHPVTRAHYNSLVECGIRIYEYTPGFIHSKTFTVDDNCAVVGTINMDYRSLYLHFECGAWLYESDAIAEVKADFFDILEVSEEITLEIIQKVPVHIRLFQSVLRIFAPLM